MRSIITISREFGSGGREIGKKLADDLGIPFYDKELLEMASKESGICQELFVKNDESKYTKTSLGYTMQSIISFILTSTTEEERKGLRGLHGELFTDVSEMCLYYDIDEELYLSRIRSGMSKEEALVTKDNADIRNWVLSLNDGTQLSLMRKFKPDLTRLEFHEIERNRKLAGKSMDIRKWSAEEIVQFKEGSKFENKADQVTDWSGRVFPNLEEMCRCYCISVDEFNRSILLAL